MGIELRYVPEYVETRTHVSIFFCMREFGKRFPFPGNDGIFCAIPEKVCLSGRSPRFGRRTSGAADVTGLPGFAELGGGVDRPGGDDRLNLFASNKF
jgi:hypothetical protein